MDAGRKGDRRTQNERSVGMYNRCFGLETEHNLTDANVYAPCSLPKLGFERSADPHDGGLRQPRGSGRPGQAVARRAPRRR